MTAIVIDKALREQLEETRHEVRLCDETGSTLGWFVPEAEYMKVLYERARHMFTEEELEPARKSPGEYTTAQSISAPVGTDEMQRRLREPSGKSLT